MLPTSHTMTRKAYKSDITDAQWQLIEAFIPPAKTGGRPRTVNVREVVNGIFARSTHWMFLGDAPS
ncbi:hypothetical protein BJP34_17810 [Moorena producens PAL-8-15-08-1]|uniref:Insertion element IS402-like domain-containing protein n=2 Tax=Moorena TaxID=1155738 RepID=A0A1D8TTS5_9CYAN|nr:hypothetical protein BJP34_17810 [Moorena producens PAL-8-15-08-1]